MAHLLVHHHVEDYKKWRPLFNEHGKVRSEQGSKSGIIFRSANDPNEIFALFEWDSVENAKKFAQSDSLKETMKKAGVQGIPDVYFIEEIGKTPA